LEQRVSAAVANLNEATQAMAAATAVATHAVHGPQALPGAVQPYRPTAGTPQPPPNQYLQALPMQQQQQSYRGFSMGATQQPYNRGTPSPPYNPGTPSQPHLAALASLQAQMQQLQEQVFNSGGSGGGGGGRGGGGGGGSSGGWQQPPHWQD